MYDLLNPLWSCHRQSAVGPESGETELHTLERPRHHAHGGSRLKRPAEGVMLFLFVLITYRSNEDKGNPKYNATQQTYSFELPWGSKSVSSHYKMQVWLAKLTQGMRTWFPF